MQRVLSKDHVGAEICTQETVRAGLSPVTIDELEATRAGEIVWSVPEKKVFGRGHLTQSVSPCRQAPDDANLKPLMPKRD